MNLTVNNPKTISRNATTSEDFDIGSKSTVGSNTSKHYTKENSDGG